MANTTLEWRLIMLSVENVSTATVMLKTEQPNHTAVEVVKKWNIAPWTMHIVAGPFSLCVKMSSAAHKSFFLRINGIENAMPKYKQKQLFLMR
jgi:hypothetical protein